MTPGDTLSRRAIHSGFWAAAVRVGDQLLRVARTIVLARLLAPEDFGLFGIALLALSILEVFSQTGFEAALIQKKEDIEPYLDTAWSVQVIRGALLALLLAVAAPYVSLFFATPEATGLVRALAVAAALRGLANIGVVYFQKELEFQKQFVYQLSGTIVDLAVAVAAALVLRNAWALVFGLLGGVLARVIASYVIHPYRPRPALAPVQARELYSFGKWILTNNILFFASTQGDRILVGKVLGAEALGLYGLASQLANMPATEVTNVVSQVAFPTYSKLQSDLRRLRRTYLKVLQVTVLASAPLGGWILVLAGDLTRLILGDPWLAMVPAMQVLALAGIVRSVLATPGPMFKGLGRPDLQTKGQLARLGLLAVSIYPLAIWWGIVGVSASVLLSNALAAAWFSWIAIRISRCRADRFLRALAPALLAALGMVSTVCLLKLAVRPVGLPSLVVLTLVSGATYLLLMLLLDRFSNYRLLSLVEEWWAAARRDDPAGQRWAE